jgi:hypothetical protein
MWPSLSVSEKILASHSCCLPHRCRQPWHRSQTFRLLLWVKSAGTLPRLSVGCHESWMSWYLGCASVFCPLSLKPTPAVSTMANEWVMLSVTWLPSLYSDWEQHKVDISKCEHPPDFTICYSKYFPVSGMRTCSVQFNRTAICIWGFENHCGSIWTRNLLYNPSSWAWILPSPAFCIGDEFTSKKAKLTLLSFHI